MAQVQQPITTIPPFADTKLLPACAISCGPLYDANGACVPPQVQQAAPTAYEACFCANDAVKAFSTATAGVCDNACQGPGLNSIATWFRGLCDVEGGGNNGGNNGGGGNGNGGRPTGTGSPANNGNNDGGGDWFSDHWQWVAMLIALVVGLGGLWIGACIWRRRYLKKKEALKHQNRQSGSAVHHSWGPDAAQRHLGSGPPIGSSPAVNDSRAAGSFMPGAQAAAVEEKPRRKFFGGR